MNSPFPLFGFIRLHAKGSCRATQWQNDGTQSCFTAREWTELIRSKREGFTLTALRARIEDFRLVLSDTLGKDGIDSLGALRSLLLSERVSTTLDAWIRDGGWVHVLVASGIHLLVIQEMIEKSAVRLGVIFDVNPITLEWITRAAKWMAFLFFWALTGFRSGLFRVLLIQIFRDHLKLKGKFKSSPVLLLVACLCDLGLAWFFSLGNESTIAEFGAGRVHYALSIYGGYFGYLVAKERGYSGVRAHFMLALCSWFPTAVYDLITEGKISFLIPLYSLISIPFLTAFVFPVSLLSILGSGVGIDRSSVCLEWLSVFWNGILKMGCEWTYALGLYREIDKPKVWIAIGLGIIMSAIVCATLLRGVNDHRRRQTHLR